MTISTIVPTRRIGQVAASHLEPKPGIIASNECDSNVDTCCLGKNFVILEYSRRVADVYAYGQSIKPIQGVPIINGTTAWDDPESNQTYIFIVIEALYYEKKLDRSLLKPNEIRHQTCSSPRRAVCSHSMVCSKNSLLIRMNITNS